MAARGPVETAVAGDLEKLPEALRKGGLAAAALDLARTMDSTMSARDTAALARELRSNLDRLSELAERQAPKDSKVLELKRRRAETFLGEAG